MVFSIIKDIIIPIIIDMKHDSIVKKPLYVDVNSLTDSGIKSVIDTHNITPAANERDEAVILSLFLFLSNNIAKPNKVDSPANVVSMNEPIKLFIISPINLYEKKISIC